MGIKEKVLRIIGHPLLSIGNTHGPFAGNFSPEDYWKSWKEFTKNNPQTTFPTMHRKVKIVPPHLPDNPGLGATGWHEPENPNTPHTHSLSEDTKVLKDHHH